MLVTSDIRLFQASEKRLGENEAETMITCLKEGMNHRFESGKEIFATKDDLGKLRSDIMRSVYGVGVVQLIAIISSVLAIVFFLPK